MNIFRTGLLLAAMTALFLGVGYLIGGVGGALVAFVFALGMNLYDKRSDSLFTTHPNTQNRVAALHEMAGAA